MPSKAFARGRAITAGLFRNLSREAAARFAFLLAVPVMAAAGLAEFLGYAGESVSGPVDTRAIVLGLVLSAVTHQLIVIGEAANAVSVEARETYPELPWQQMVGMRNSIVHAYWTVDADRVWNTVESDLPDLVARLQRSLQIPEND